MMESLPWPAITAASGGWALTAAYTWAVLTGRLVPRDSLTEVVKRADRWEGVALRALGVAEKMTTQGEVTTAIVASLPDPSEEQP